MSYARTDDDGRLIHTAFADQASQRPDATAIIYDGDRISYRTLNSASDGYAADLAARGVGSGDIVPILIPRSPQLVAIQLAILKCGAAYSNIDSHWPPARQAAIVRQMETRLMVGTATSVAVDDVGSLLVPMEDLAGAEDRASSFDPSIVGSSAPAAVFFTSGSTGTPKGVVVPHRSVTRLFGNDGLPGFGPGHVTPQAAAIAFDMHAFEQWGQLTTGGTVVVVPDVLMPPDTLRALVQTAGVDTVWLTASLFNLFVDEDVDCFRGLRQLLIGGEKLSPAHVKTFMLRHPNVPLNNGYGPAENGMLTTTHLVRPGDCENSEGIPLGRAVPHTAFAVISQEGLPCATGEVGEICVEGMGLAIGYLDQPELTAKQFSVMKIDGKEVRVYRTGDLGLLDDDGLLYFRGRMDRQVKINGFRIEPAELEVAAQSIRGIRQCRAVTLLGSYGQATKLALFYLPDVADQDDEHQLSESNVKAELNAHLPSHLVPAVIRQIDSFPLTLNGKTNDEELRRMASAPPSRSTAS